MTQSFGTVWVEVLVLVERGEDDLHPLFLFVGVFSFLEKCYNEGYEVT